MQVLDSELDFSAELDAHVCGIIKAAQWTWEVFA